MNDKNSLSLATLVSWLLDDACAAGRYVLRAYLIQFIPVVVLGLCLSALLDGPGTSRPSRPGSILLGMGSGMRTSSLWRFTPSAMSFQLGRWLFSESHLSNLGAPT
jgi:hypothetical protein